MNARVGWSLRFVSLFLTAALMLAGCVGTRAGRGSTGGATLQGVTDDYQQALRQTAATEEALLGIVFSPQPDLRQAFGFFSANQQMMEQIGGRLLQHADGMFYRGTFYFVESGRSLEACALPRTGRTDDLRVIDLGEDFDSVSEAGGEIKRAYRAFQFDIEKIHDYLANNLTPAGVDSIGQIFDKAQVDSASLEEALDHGVAALEQARTSLARKAQPTAAPPPPPSPRPQQ